MGYVEHNMSLHINLAAKRRDEAIQTIKMQMGHPKKTSTNTFDLTPENWEERIADKTIFIKFFAPWCGHCKAIKHDWDKLMSDFEGTITSLVGEVDCTGKGKTLCEKYEVTGF